jgi:outer membrane murein-binding lipoprotein Lpp
MVATTRWQPVLSAGLVVAMCALAGCADRPPTVPRVALTSTVTGLTAAKAASILSSFDAADSAATAAGNIEALRSQEITPALQSSIAAARRNALTKRAQPGYRHTNPRFAVPAGDATCFMVGATLHSTGTELGVTDSASSWLLLTVPGG